MQIAIVGDIMVQGRVADHVAADGGRELVARLKETLVPADIAIGNLETFITPSGVDPGNEWFSPPEAVDIVAQAGFDAVGVAVNHAHDHGVETIRHTLALLARADVAVFGLGDAEGNEPTALIIEREGLKIGLLGYASQSSVTRQPAYTAAMPTASRLRRDVLSLRERYDVLIVSIHHGHGEYPDPELRKWCRAAADAGADVVVAHHSHLLSGVERYGGGVIAYGISNAVAYFEPGPKRRGMCLRLEVEGGKVTDTAYDLFVLDDHGYPARGTENDLLEIGAAVDRINEALQRKDYDRFYWSTVDAADRASYFRSWRRELKAGGLRALLAKIRCLRWHHVKLLLRLPFAR